MAYDLAKVTANGNNLIAQILANKSSLSVDKIEISDTQLPSTTDISTMTSVPKVVQTVSANGFSKNSNTLIISTVVDNSSIRADYKAWIFGIWGSDSQNGRSQLIAVITSTNSPDTIPAFSGRTPVSYTYKFNIGFSNASQIQFNMIIDSFATNDTVVHTTGDETIDGQKKFKTDPTDSAGNAYAKTVDVNQQLDKKVVDNKDGTEQLNGIRVQPFNKLSDVEDHRNYLTGTANDLIISANASNFNYYRLFYPLVPGEKYTFSSEVTLTGTANNLISVRVYQSDGNSNTTTFNDAFVADGTRHSWTFVCPPNGYYLFIYAGVTGNTANIGATFHHSQLELGLPTPWHESISDKQDKIGYTPADDSKVAHLSGANNFDTVPTVNNNPLLLASSLPSDLARTGQANTFTAAQTFSIAPTITDASKDKGDNQAATMADLKSVENSAWHQLNKDYVPLGGTFLYKIDRSSKRIYVIYSEFRHKFVNVGATIADFSSIVNHITSINADETIFSVHSPASIVTATGQENLQLQLSDGAYFTYDSLR
ncbi:hypothetical protein K9P40_05045 [Lentilactobacillus otakiensis]|uniref:hypothetical protein n=1 Tax=Lentilactobacillus otakiensis TaxID=481720 RepID=UPI001CBBD1A7|nr:hypothetical protein [Lentilactobacillus otakiensis]MBZ3776441.1 hypothetical protein [Lentilactobacillus otakiensis]